MTTEFYSVKQAPLAGVEIDWYFVKLADGTYEYMLSKTKLANALGLHKTLLGEFLTFKGWNPCCYELFLGEGKAKSILKLNVVVNALTKAEREAHLLTTPQANAFMQHILSTGSGNARFYSVVSALVVESLETRFDQLYNKPLKTAEQKDSELVARLTKEVAEQTIKELGPRLHAAGGSVSQKREFLNLLLEGHTAKELVEKELKDSGGHVLMGKGSGKKRSYTKLNLCDPTHAEHLRELYRKIALEMCFVPVGADCKTEWHAIAAKELKRSKLPQAVKTEMLTRVVVYMAQ